MDPTFTGFIWWVTNMMGVPENDMPTNDVLQFAYDEAINIAYLGLATIPSQPTSNSIYAMAVYNLAGAFLLQFAQDTPPSTYWSDLRSSLSINAFTPGIVQAASDQGTSDGLYIPEVIKGMTLLDLQLAKSPWGQMYLMLAGQWGSLWGITI